MCLTNRNNSIPKSMDSTSSLFQGPRYTCCPRHSCPLSVRSYFSSSLAQHGLTSRCSVSVTRTPTGSEKGSDLCRSSSSRTTAAPGWNIALFTLRHHSGGFALSYLSWSMFKVSGA